MSSSQRPGLSAPLEAPALIQAHAYCMYWRSARRAQLPLQKPHGIPFKSRTATLNGWFHLYYCTCIAPVSLRVFMRALLLFRGEKENVIIAESCMQRLSSLASGHHCSVGICMSRLTASECTSGPVRIRGAIVLLSPHSHKLVN